MASKGINKVILVGNLGKDPEVRYTPNGKAVANLTLATSESWKDQSGQIQEKTEWHRVSMFGKLAEIAGEYLRKGSQVYIEGKLQTNKWKDQQGQDRYTTEVVLDPFNGVMQMLGGKGGQSNQSEGGYQNQQRPASPPQQNQGVNQDTNQGQPAPQYQQRPNQGGSAPSNQGANQGTNQAPQQGQNKPAPMAEPDFDFDDDIPF